jgi:hypothetical protein
MVQPHHTERGSVLCCYLRGRVHGKLNAGLLAIVDRQALQQQRTETGTSAAAKGVKDHETLQTRALIGQLADAVQDQVNDFTADGVVATSVVVGSVFLLRGKRKGAAHDTTTKQ